MHGKIVFKWDFSEPFARYRRSFMKVFGFSNGKLNDIERHIFKQSTTNVFRGCHLYYFYKTKNFVLKLLIYNGIFRRVINAMSL